MDGREPTDALTDSALDREMEALLAVEPSPAFVARVRARVAEQPAPRAWVFRWELAAVVGVTVLVAGAVIWQSRGPAGSILDVTSVATPRIAQSAGVTAPTPHAEQPATSKHVADASRKRRDRSRATTAIEVSRDLDLMPLVAPADAKAFDRLLATVRKPDVVLVLSTTAPGPPWLETSTIMIEPIAIDPVPPVAQVEGGVE